MASSLKWDHDLATSAISSIDAASDSISGDSVESPSGCGYSASAASAVVTRLQAALSGLQSGIGNQFAGRRHEYHDGRYE